MNLAVTQPMPTEAPQLLYIINADMPDGSACVVAKHNTTHGETWRTRYDGPNVSMRDIRAALAAHVA